MRLNGAFLALSLALAPSTSHIVAANDDASAFIRSRELAFDWIAGYEPQTLITDHAAIDLDQAEMERLLKDDRQFDAAKAVYEKGGHSQPIARLTIKTLPEVPEKPIPAGTIVVGENTKGEAIQGRSMTDIMWNEGDEETVIHVQYQGDHNLESYVECQIGGLIMDESDRHEGCFADTGFVRVLDFNQRDSPVYVFVYGYDIRKDNINGMTLQKFSKVAEKEMWDCGDNCPYKDYAKFIRYYQQFDYGDHWIQAAFNGTETDFKYGNTDFSKFELPARAESIKYATKVLNIWMYIVGTLEHAIDQCEIPCTGGRDSPCDDSPLRAWDQAVAFYTGSLEGDSGAGQGLLIYNLADQMCAQFRTCGEDATGHYGTSYVNNKIIGYFQEGQRHMMRRQCEEGRQLKTKIVKLMTVPLVQSTLQMAYNQNFLRAVTDEDIAIDEAKGSVVAASILPIVHECDKQHAATIYDNMKVKGKSDKEVDFEAVKTALEKSYSCMGITCDMVGGYWKHLDSDYAYLAAPCRGIEDEETRPASSTVWLVMFSVLTVFSATLLVAYSRHDRREDFVPERSEGPEINIGVSFD